MLLDKFTSGRQCLDDFMEDASKDLQVVRWTRVSVLVLLPVLTPE